MTTTHIKFTLPNARPIYGQGKYSLPKRDQPGRWMTKKIPRICESGYHVSNPDYLAVVIGPEAWEVEVRGLHVEGSDKQSWEQMRFVRQLPWTMQDMVEFAQDCAARNARYVAAGYARYVAAGSAGYAAAAAAAAAAARNAAAAAAARNARCAARNARYARYAAAAEYAAERKRQSDWIRSRIAGNEQTTSFSHQELK